MSVTTKPYLVRAIYEWCVDQGFTPYMAAQVDENTRIPPGTARDGQIVLNVGPDATHQLTMGNDFITFQARFAGVAHTLRIPVGNVLAVYARENGQGMAFEVEGLEAGMSEGSFGAEEAETAADVVPAKPEGERPHLKIIK